MRLKIVSVGEAVLRQQARPLTVAEIRSAEIQQLIQHMRETMNDAPGVGLAAPQVGFPLQLAVIEDKQEYFAGLDRRTDRRARTPAGSFPRDHQSGAAAAVRGRSWSSSRDASACPASPRLCRARARCVWSAWTRLARRASLRPRDGTHASCSTKSITCMGRCTSTACRAVPSVPSISTLDFGRTRPRPK